MAELKKKEGQLTTADLAGRSEKPGPSDYESTAPDRPKPVQSDTGPRMRVTTPTTPRGSEVGGDPGMRDPGMRNDRDVTVGNTGPRDDRDVKVMPQRTQNDMTPTPLFSQADVGDLRERWTDVQTGFVDEPRHAVEEADKLVATVMTRLAEGFANERGNLEKQWDRGDNVSTEDLRVAMQRYRSFFDRLLNA
jgi:hypothetical protein